jgi:predicted nuclease of predicted toxin-antitoxin system
MRLLIDEDLPRSLAPLLRSAGHDVFDVRDIGLRGRPDQDVFLEAQQRGAVLVSGDRGFANIVSHPPGSHAGIVIAHFPTEMPTAVLNQQVLGALESLGEGEVAGNLVMVEPARIRIRRARAT